MKNIKRINMNETINQVRVSKQAYKVTQKYKIMEGDLENFKRYIKNTALKTKFEELLISIGISPNKNTLMTLLIEITKLITLAEKNLNLLLVGEKSQGKSASYTLVLSEKCKIISGIPTVAELRGNQISNDSVTPLLDEIVLLIEEIADSTDSIKSIPLLKTALESREYLKCNKTKQKTDTSVIITANNYKDFKDYDSIITSTLIETFPSNSKDEAFLNRFNGILPHYKNLFSEKYYSENGLGFPIVILQEALESYRNIPSKAYDIDLDGIEGRNITQVYSIINGFVKLFFADDTPPKYFIDAIGEWAKYINSLTSFKPIGKTPFNSKWCGLIKELFYKDKEVEYFSFLSGSRVLVKFKEPTINNTNSEILALDGFGVNENREDWSLYNKYKNDSLLEEITNLTQENKVLELSLSGNIATPKKYNCDGKQLPFTSIDDEEFNNLVISEIEKYAMFGNESPKLKELNFRGIPSFLKEDLKKNIERHLKLTNLPKMLETTYTINENNVKFLNLAVLRKEDLGISLNN
ncbi:BREX system Lon protease-like protein BrxL [Cetobacterium somerae]|uniref:BREX system Lon protease-like protein BrxL n=1 Tax=Cetobacterium somerae TaxID=188913 RepID=UPI0038918510